MSIESFSLVKQGFAQLPAPVRERIERNPGLFAAGAAVTVAGAFFAARAAWSAYSSPRLQATQAVVHPIQPSATAAPVSAAPTVIPMAPAYVLQTDEAPTTLAQQPVPLTREVQSSLQADEELLNAYTQYLSVTGKVDGQFVVPAVPQDLMTGSVQDQAAKLRVFLSDVTHLGLANKNLTKFPFDPSLFPKLQILCLRDNPLESIPLEVCQLRALKILTLDNTQLTSLPEEIANLTELSQLHLTNNPKLNPGTGVLLSLPRNCSVVLKNHGISLETQNEFQRQLEGHRRRTRQQQVPQGPIVFFDGVQPTKIL